MYSLAELIKANGDELAELESLDNGKPLASAKGDMAAAVNHLIRAGGGQVVVEGGEVRAFLPLPIGGIVADLEPERMAEAEDALDDAARALGCELPTPFGYLIFLAITAIPDYAITDLGLVDCVQLTVVDPVLEAA
jgi:adenine deaminase